MRFLLGSSIAGGVGEKLVGESQGLRGRRGRTWGAAVGVDVEEGLFLTSANAKLLIS